MVFSYKKYTKGNSQKVFNRKNNHKNKKGKRVFRDLSKKRNAKKKSAKLFRKKKIGGSELNVSNNHEQVEYCNLLRSLSPSFQGYNEAKRTIEHYDNVLEESPSGKITTSANEYAGYINNKGERRLFFKSDFCDLIWKNIERVTYYREYIQQWLTIQNIGNHSFGDKRKFLLPLSQEKQEVDICMEKRIIDNQDDNYTWPLTRQQIRKSEKREQEFGKYRQMLRESCTSNTSESDTTGVVGGEGDTASAPGDTQCEIYISGDGKHSCVNKNRIHFFRGNESALTINTQGDNFKLYDTIPIISDMEQSKRMTNNLYCQVLFNADKRQLYILSAIGFTKEDIWKIEYEKQFERIYQEYIESNETDYDKLILCGHSMGAVLSLRLGYYIWIHNQELFNNKCLVLGTCPFRWRPSDMRDIEHVNVKYTEKSMNDYESHSNVMIFYAAFSILPEYENYPNEESDWWEVGKLKLATVNDDYINRPNESLRKNCPGLYLSIIPKKEHSKKVVRREKVNGSNISNNHTYWSTILLLDTHSSDSEDINKICYSSESLHDWENYSSRLEYLLSFLKDKKKKI